jgi:hypothetical protein
VIADTLTLSDLDTCASFCPGWKKIGFPPPLLIAVHELPRAIEAFPLEFAEILATRKLIAGTDLLAALKVPIADLRRACEVQARGHLVHLREAYIEAAGNGKAVAQLVQASHTPFRALVANVARLDGMNVDELISRIGLGGQTFRETLNAAERLVEYVDGWGKK